MSSFSKSHTVKLPETRPELVKANRSFSVQKRGESEMALAFCVDLSGLVNPLWIWWWGGQSFSWYLSVMCLQLAAPPPACMTGLVSWTRPTLTTAPVWQDTRARGVKTVSVGWNWNLFDYPNRKLILFRQKKMELKISTILRWNNIF